MRRPVQRFCLWGGGRRWVQINSPADRHIQPARTKRTRKRPHPKEQP